MGHVAAITKIKGENWTLGKTPPENVATPSERESGTDPSFRKRTRNMKKNASISEQELFTFLRKFPISIAVEQGNDGLYTWWVAGLKGAASTALDAAQAAVKEAFAVQARIVKEEQAYEDRGHLNEDH